MSAVASRPMAPDEVNSTRAQSHLAGGGVLIVDKPSGPTSAKVVAQVKRILGARRVGHTGTLDPMATGVLPLCIGPATKIAGYLLADDKEYEGTLRLGVETDTLDAEGTVTAENPAAAAALDEAVVAATMATFVGPSQQVPPMYSALKQGGRRLHQLARAGQVVDRPSRSITIVSLHVLRCELPQVRFHVHCSKGTYIRSLVADIGTALGCGAHLTALRRVRSGPFHIARAVALDRITTATAAEALISVADALPHLPSMTLAGERCSEVATGKKLTWRELLDARPGHDATVTDATALPSVTASAVKLTSEQGRLLALIAAPEPHADGSERIHYLRVVPSDLTRRA